MRTAIALIGLLLASCGARDDVVIEQRLLAMGTWVDVTLLVDDERHGYEALASVEALLREIERDYYPWADGELARVNAAIAASEPIEVTPEMAALLNRSRELTVTTDGCFDPGVGKLVELWGFGPEERPVPPDDSAVEAWRARGASLGAVEIAGREVRSSNPDVLIDLGGIAKGAAVDRTMALLAARGIANALVNAGGDLSVMGTRGGRPWRIGIQAPRGDGLLGALELEPGETAFTSGDYERYYEDGGGRRSHILDPQTGHPVTHTQAVTVLAHDGTTADAAATALFVAGPERWRAMAQALGIAAVLRVDASGRIEMTDPMRERLQTSGDAASDIIAP
jgi:FAD:protein FMN transferase